MHRDERTAWIKARARSLGFDRVGITAARPIERAAYYRDWLARGHAGSMDYLTRNIESRCDPATLLPGAQSLICTAINYHRPKTAFESDSGGMSETAPSGRIAQYARGVDYHIVVRGLLERLIAAMRGEFGALFEARACVDTAPLLERELAAAAGIGWIGKNTLVMHESLGSFLFLGEVVTTLDLAADAPTTDHCGTCTRCLDACPTRALIAPYQMDASRCISYLTIEHGGEIEPSLANQMSDWIYGCDICQDVCPHNNGAPAGVESRIMADRLPARLPLKPLTVISNGDHRRLTRDSATRRASRRMWRRNAAIALENRERIPSAG